MNGVGGNFNQNQYNVQDNQGYSNNPSSSKKHYLPPFSDYPSYHLSGCSIEEVAEFAANYVCGHIRRSPNIDLLLHNFSEFEENLRRLESVRNKVAQENDIKVGAHAAYSASNYNFEKFMNATSILAEGQVGNSQELSFVAARALKEFGCPYSVTIMQIDGRLENGEDLHHNFLKIKNEAHVWYADPFFSLLNQEQREKLTGNFRCPAYWPEIESGEFNADRYLYVTTARMGTRDMKLLPFIELNRMDGNRASKQAVRVFELIEIKKENNGEIIFHPPSKPWAEMSVGVASHSP